MDYAARLNRLRALMAVDDLQGFFVSNLTNIRYLCGFSGSNAFLLVSHDGAWFFSDGRYRLQAAEQVAEAEIGIFTTHSDLVSALGERKARSGLSRIGFEGGDVTVASRRPGWELPPGMDKLGTYFPGSELVATGGWIEGLRRIKEPAEVGLMREAARMADEGLEYILNKVGPGMTEREIALDLEFRLRTRGAEDVSFDPIVGAAEGSAFVHGRPSDRPVKKDRYLLIDVGCILDGYCSDLTRTVVVGKADSRHREVYEAVLAAQLAALQSLRAGTPSSEVDGAARAVLENAGLGEAFSHGLGHGVGLQIHEEPSLKKEMGNPLETGNVVTIEPGAYLPGWGGVRIEDLVLVTEGGGEPLSSARKQLIEI